MKPMLAALLLLLAVVFASYDMPFLALITIASLAIMATADAGTAMVTQPSNAAASAPSASGNQLVKKITVTKDGKTRTKIVDFVEKDEAKWAPPGKPKDWHDKTSYEAFGSGLAQTVWAPFKLAGRVANWIAGK